MKPLITLLYLASVLSFVGCSAGPQGWDENHIKETTERGAKMRRFFDSVGGDYGKLGEADRKAFIEMFQGGETEARKAWETMAHPPVG